MQYPTLNIRARFSVAIQKSVNQLFNPPANHLRYIFGEENVETGVAQIKAHGAERIGKGVGFSHQDSRTGFVLACDHHSGGSIAEKNGGDQICLSNILALEG